MRQPRVGYAGEVSARKSNSPRDLVAWLVYRVGGPRGRMLGIVKAADYASALAAALAAFDIAPDDAKRIMVRATRARGAACDAPDQRRNSKSDK